MKQNSTKTVRLIALFLFVYFFYANINAQHNNSELPTSTNDYEGVENTNIVDSPDVNLQTGLEGAENVQADIPTNKTGSLKNTGAVGPIGMAVEHGNHIYTDGDGYGYIGDITGYNLGFDQFNIQGRDGTNLGSPLYLNFWGGSTYISTGQDESTANTYIGTNASNEGFLNAHNTFYVKGDTDNVGIGTFNPATKLHVYNGSGTGGGTYSSAIDAVIEDDNFAYLGFNGSGWAGITFNANNNSIYSGVFYNNASNRLMFKTGGVDNRMTIDQSGGVGIGTTSVPSGYRLSVDGNIIAERVRVQLSQNWPDYVFQEDYNLMTIDDLKKNIAQNGHLPNIPDAATMTAEGQDLGEMQVKMMEKIEELTLYIIDLNERIKTLENENTELKTTKK